MVFAAPLSAGVVERSKEISQYTVLVASSTKNVRFAALRELAWIGLSDQVLFDLVANQLREKLAAKTLEIDLQETALLMAALSGSGLAQFDELFNQVAKKTKNKQLKAKVKIAKNGLVRSAQLNPKKNSDQYVNAQIPFSVAVFLNFIYADELPMKRQAVKIIGAERMTNHHILQALEIDISNNYLSENDDSDWATTYLQMCDVLVYAGGVGYGPLIKNVAHNAANERLRNGAKDLIDKYELNQKNRL
jgi:hypothetical protein